MFGLKIAAVGLLHLASGGGEGVMPSVQCQLHHPLTIRVAPNLAPVDYDYTKTNAELNEIGDQAYSPYDDMHKTELRGLTVGRQYLRHKIDFYYEHYPHAKAACLQIKHIDVSMDYHPTVYVSREYRQGSPIFNNVLRHEKQHVRITQDVLDEYAPLLERRLRRALQGRYQLGPFAVEQMDTMQAQLAQRVTAIKQEVNQQMLQEAQRRHNRFDDETMHEVLDYKKDVAQKLEEIFKIE